MKTIQFAFFYFLISFSFLLNPSKAQEISFDYDEDILTGADQISAYISLLKSAHVAVVANQTSMVGNVHLVDTLLALKVNIKKVFAPEHGFRGEAGAGETISNATDKKTGLPLISLYGSKLKPSSEDLDGISIVVFDIQDVGARFYTYISTLQYVMEACAEKNIQCIVLDRPNPNGFYIDGPVLEKKYASFVGMNAVPAVYGMTIGEYAAMLNGEHWLAKGITCRLKIIPLKGYDHSSFYRLPQKPSPNLPDMASVYLYPSLCFFEGTAVSVGRGTDRPFKIVGYPGFEKGTVGFTPQTIPGVVKSPPYEGKICNGIDLEEFGEMFIRDYRGIYLFWLRSFYQSYPEKDKFFNDFFNKLAGNDLLKKQIMDGMDEESIRQSWKPGIASFKLIRSKYLLYKDF